MGDEGPEPCEPEADVEKVYDAALCHTMLVIPLLPTVTVSAIAAAVGELNVDSLIFLNCIRGLHFRNLEDPSQDLDFALGVTSADSGEIDFEGEAAAVDVTEVRVLAPAEQAERTRYLRYSTRRAVGPGETRANKATGSSTPIGNISPGYQAVNRC